MTVKGRKGPIGSKSVYQCSKFGIHATHNIIVLVFPCVWGYPVVRAASLLLVFVGID